MNGRRIVKSGCFHRFVMSGCLHFAFLGFTQSATMRSSCPDGLAAAENNIAEIHVYSGGEKRSIDVDSYIYRTFASQINNCGGHLLKIQKATESEIWNDEDCFIEIIYASAQTITFENADNFSMENADRLLYNADRNILYWGDSGYQNCVDFTKMNEELLAH